MPDQDAAAGGSTEDEAAQATDRLERALERIAASAHRAAAETRRAAEDPLMDGGSTREVATRLDALIAQLRSALDRN